MRFIAKVLKDSLHEKFPDASEDELLKVRIGSLDSPGAWLEGEEVGGIVGGL